jgi:hypothetical protein
MTSDHPLRRALARFCSTDTMTRIVDPTFADMRLEDGRVTLQGCFALAKALALHGIVSLPGWLANACSDDDYALVRAAAFTMAGATILAIALMAPPLSDGVRRIHTSLYGLGIRLIPEALVMSLPSMLVLAIPVVFGPIGTVRSIAGRALLLTVAGLVATIAVTVIMPRANQSYRELVNGAPVARGVNESGFGGLRTQIRDYQKTHGGHSVAQRLEYVYQLRAATMVSGAPFGIAGVAIVALTRKRRVSIAIGVAILVSYWGLLLTEDRLANAAIIRGGFLPEYFCAWTPNVILLIAASAVLRIRHSAFAIQH